MSGHGRENQLLIINGKKSICLEKQGMGACRA